MLSQYEDFRTQIRKEIALSNKYDEAFLNLIKYRKIIDKYPKEDTMEDFWFATYNTGLIYKKINNIEQALIYAKKSVRYFVNNDNYVKSTCLIARCLEEKIKNVDDENQKTVISEKIKRIYRKCVKIYLKADSKSMATFMQFNLEHFLRNFDNMFTLICELDKWDGVSNTYSKFDETKPYIVKSLYEEFIQDCINENNKEYIIRLLNSVTKETKIEIMKYLKDSNILLL